MTGRIALPALVCMLATSGCGIARERTAVDERGVARLTGTWRVRFHLVTPTAGRDTLGVPDVRGAIALLAGARRRSVPQLDDLTHTGSYDVDFRPFGFDPRDQHEIPRAVARVSLPDSVEIVLDPGERQTPVVMQGTWAGDSIAGIWQLLVPGRGWGGGATGLFTMTRSSSAPPVPPSR